MNMASSGADRYGSRQEKLHQLADRIGACHHGDVANIADRVRRRQAAVVFAEQRLAMASFVDSIVMRFVHFNVWLDTQCSLGIFPVVADDPVVAGFCNLRGAVSQ